MPKIIKNSGTDKKTIEQNEFCESFSIELDSDDVDMTVSYIIKNGIASFLQMNVLSSGELSQLISSHYRAAVLAAPEEPNIPFDNDDIMAFNKGISQKNVAYAQKQKLKVDLAKSKNFLGNGSATRKTLIDLDNEILNYKADYQNILNSLKNP